MQVPVECPLGLRGPLDRIGALVLLGEAAGDSRLQEVVEAVFTEKELQGVIEAASNQDHRSVEPVFAAAIGAAKGCLENLDKEEFQRRHPGGCEL